MQAKSRLLEPYYAFRLEVPPEQLGRAINDVRLRSGSFDTPEEAGDLTLLRGRVPVTEFDDYAQEVASYTGAGAACPWNRRATDPVTIRRP